MACNPCSVDLTGSPETIGSVWGRINGPDIRAHLQQFLKLARSEHGLSEDTLVERSEPYSDMMSELAPHWLVEARAVAGAAGVDVALYGAFLAGKYRGLLFPEECTSYAAVGVATADGRPLFHKNRDNVMRPQAFYRKHTLVPGRELLAFIGTGDTSDTGVMMMVNAAGLAGSADQAGPDPRPRYRGLMNPYGLRLIAETATNCEEAIQIVRMMNARGLYAGGKIVTRWTFVDASGTAVTVLNTHDRVRVEQLTRVGVLWTVERPGLPELLHSRQGKLTPADMAKASRLPGVCVESNCSCLTAAIDPERPEVFTYASAALGPANRTAYFPLYMGQEQTPAAYLDGEVYRYSLGPVEAESAAAFEGETERIRREAEAAARGALAAGDEASAREHLQRPALEALRMAEERLKTAAVADLPEAAEGAGS